MITKGIVLAGGTGTRLSPLTKVISKQLIAVYDKPMIYYSLTTLMFSGIRDILIITAVRDQLLFYKQLGDGSQWGINIQYASQTNPGGLAEAFIIGKDFIGNDGCALILGDNIFYGHRLADYLQLGAQQKVGATIFGYWVKDPTMYGVIELNKDGKPISIEEKPDKPKSNYAVTGLYYYDNQVVSMAKELKPSMRGELEITDINKLYLDKNQLKVQQLNRGFAWIDCGTFASLLQAANFVSTIEERQGQKICCPEEVAFRLGYISEEKLENLAYHYNNSEYGEYLLTVLQHNKNN